MFSAATIAVLISQNCFCSFSLEFFFCSVCQSYCFVLKFIVFFLVLIFLFFSCDTRLRSDFFATIFLAKAAAVNEIHYDDVVIENYYWKRCV